MSIGKSGGRASFAAIGVLAAFASGVAFAEIKVGVVVSETGPAAAVLKTLRNAAELFPSEIGGEKVRYLIQDDRSDVSASTMIVRRLITDDKVDILVGPGLTPTAAAAVPVANEGKTPMLSLSPVVVDDKNTWAFNMTPPIAVMARALADHMVKSRVKTLAVIGFPDTWGDQWMAAIKSVAEPQGITIVADERFGRTDASVTGQVLKMLAKRPDAILVAASGSGAAVPQLELVARNYKGLVYHTHGIDKINFMKVAGPAAEGVIFPMGPAAAAEGLPNSFITKKQSMEFVKAYEGKFGANSRTTTAAHTYDVIYILQAAIPVALKSAKPGTAEFRAALRSAIESIRDLPGSNGVYSYSATDHSGVSDKRSALPITVKNGAWVPLVP